MLALPWILVVAVAAAGENTPPVDEPKEPVEEVKDTVHPTIGLPLESVTVAVSVEYPVIAVTVVGDKAIATLARTIFRFAVPEAPPPAT